MSHHRTPRDQPTLHDRLWAIQEQLHGLARRLDRPGPHGAQYPSDIYDLLGALTVATRDIADITHRAARMLTDASTHRLTTRPLTATDRNRLERTQRAARHLTEALEQAQTTINDIGGHLTRRWPSQLGGSARQLGRGAPPPPRQGRRR